MWYTPTTCIHKHYQFGMTKKTATNKASPIIKLIGTTLLIIYDIHAAIGQVHSYISGKELLAMV